MTQPTVVIDVQWQTLDSEAVGQLRQAVVPERLRRLIRACFLDDAHLALCVVGAEQAKQLNAQYRGKNYATNVLTFPIDPPNIPDMPIFWADVVVCAEVVMAEAKAQGKTVWQHFAHMVVHACLHAQGYTHDADFPAMLMEQREIHILRRFGISNPYA